MKRFIVSVIIVGLLCSQLSIALAGDEEIWQAVKNYPSKLYGTIGEGLTLVLSVTSVDYVVKAKGWSVTKPESGKSYIVRFHFIIDGKPDYAEWFYGAGSGIVTPRNVWAREVQY
jgi:hypothetical protein